MDVVALDVLVSLDGNRRGRVCRRADGMFQFVTERLRALDDELESYWLNDYPPSGIYDRRDAALSALKRALPTSAVLTNAMPTTFNINVGPYPEPDQLLDDETPLEL